ncbi:MAG: ATP-binding protein [bacterium]
MNLTQDKIIEILLDVNFWREDPFCGIERGAYLERIFRLAQDGLAVTLIGPRRSGKTTIMNQLIRRLISQGVPRQNTLYVNFEDPRFFGELTPEFMNRLLSAYTTFLKPVGKTYLFLDEVHSVRGWERFVRQMIDQGGRQVFVTGSSSKLLSRELGALLTGRHLDAPIYPLHFGEFLAFKGIVYDDRLERIRRRDEIRGKIREFMQWGGFPAVVLGVNQQEILLNYAGDILSRDIVERYGIAKPDNLRTLCKYYMTNVASLISYNSIKGFLSIPVDTIERWSDYFNQAFLFFFLRRFSYSLKDQEKNPRKVYCIDTGLRNAVSFRFTEDLGKLLENLVFMKYLQDGADVFYWKDAQGYEVDFVVMKRGKIGEICQVSFDVSEAKAKQRELRALLRALDFFQVKEGLIVTEELEAEETANGYLIRYVPIWKFLLQPMGELG